MLSNSIELTTNGRAPSGSATPVDAEVIDVLPPSTNGPDLHRHGSSTVHNSQFPGLKHRRQSVSSALSHHTSIHSADSLASIDRPPSRTSPTPDNPSEKLPAAKIYHPLSPHVVALLMPASVFGVLARLGIQALVEYEGTSAFPLAWVQVMGCFVMGFGVGIKDPLGQL